MSGKDTESVKNTFSFKDPLSVKNTHGMPFHSLPVWLPAPRRRPIQQVPGGRRPVVAILDTGVTDHEWFLAPEAGDPILVDAHETAGPRAGWHGTFVAGLVRQNAPDARVLSLPLERTDDGRIAAGQLTLGLTWLQARMSGGSAANFVDVICMAVGFREEPTDDPNHVSRLNEVVQALGNSGTLLVAAAGNKKDGASGPVYPAALATGSTAALPLVAVGAVNPAGTLADFSVTGDWVTRAYVGVDVVSTTPVIDENASNADDRADVVASLVTPEKYQPDPSEHGRAFGRGSGTSYAAAGFAGLVAQAMLDDPEGVADVSSDAATRRARRALAGVGWPA